MKTLIFTLICLLFGSSAYAFECTGERVAFGSGIDGDPSAEIMLGYGVIGDANGKRIGIQWEEMSDSPYYPEVHINVTKLDKSDEVSIVMYSTKSWASYSAEGVAFNKKGEVTATLGTAWDQASGPLNVRWTVTCKK